MKLSSATLSRHQPDGSARPNSLSNGRPPALQPGRPCRTKRQQSIAPIVHAAFESLAKNRPTVCPGLLGTGMKLHAASDARFALWVGDPTSSTVFQEAHRFVKMRGIKVPSLTARIKTTCIYALTNIMFFKKLDIATVSINVSFEGPHCEWQLQTANEGSGGAS